MRLLIKISILIHNMPIIQNIVAVETYYIGLGKKFLDCAGNLAGKVFFEPFFALIWDECTEGAHKRVPSAIPELLF